MSSWPPQTKLSPQHHLLWRKLLVFSKLFSFHSQWLGGGLKCLIFSKQYPAECTTTEALRRRGPERWLPLGHTRREKENVIRARVPFPSA